MSDANQWDDEHAGEDRPPKKKGMSTGMKVLLVFLGLGGVAMLVCCGGVLYVGNHYKNAVVQEPAQVAELRKEIITIELPEEFKPGGGLNAKALGPIPAMKMVAYGYADDDQAGFVVFQLTLPAGAQLGQAEMEAQMKEAQGRQQGQQNQQGQLQNVTDQTTKKYVINGKEVTFTLQTGELQNGKKYREATAFLEGETANSMRFIQLRLPLDKFNEEAVDKIINSIK